MPFPRGMGYKETPKHVYRSPLNMAIPHLPGATPRGQANNLWQLPNFFDQGALGSCMWQTIAQLVIADNLKDADPDGTPSRLFGYYNTLVLQGELADVGCDPETAMAAGARWGFPSESLWPYDVEAFLEGLNKVASGQHWAPPSLAYRDGYRKRGPLELLWITSTGTQKVNDLKVALDEGYVAGICGIVGPEYVEWKRGDAPLGPPAGYYPGSPDYGGHARVIGAYNGNVFTERGSWGKGYGDNGNWLIDASYVKSDLTSALVCVKKAPGI
jgi:hypothetical protein